MAISGISSSGIMSGLNANDLTAQILALEQRPITILQSRQRDYQLKIASVLSLNSRLASYKSSLEALNDSEKFNTLSASVSKTSTGTELLNVSASSTAAEGNYSISVNQLATSSKKASQGWVDQNTTAINSSGGTFKYKIGSSGAETSISVSSTMTLQGLRDAINTNNTGVNASIINDGTGSNSYRLILTSEDTGSANEITITDNTTSQILGFMDGSGNEPKQIEAVYADTGNNYSGSVASNNGVYYNGTDNKTYISKISTAGLSGSAKYQWSDDGGISWSSEVTSATLDNTVSQFVITASSNDTIIFNDGTERTATLTAGTYTADALATEIKTQMELANGSADTYTASYSAATGKFTIENDVANTNSITMNWSSATSTSAGILGFDGVDTVVAVASSDVSDYSGGMYVDGSGIANAANGGVKLIFGTTGTLSVDDKFSIDVFNPTMQQSMDAVIEVDNATIVKSSNTITDAIQGVTLSLLTADVTETLTLSVSSSSSSANSSINDFVSSYNDLFEFIDEQLSYDTETGTAKPLIGDPTLLEIRRRVAETITGTVPGLSSASYTNLAQIGISSNYETGLLEVDDLKLSSALSDNPIAVSKLFAGTATATNQAISYEGKSSSTVAGTYGISISTAPEQASLTGDNDLSTTALGADEILTFKYSDNYTNASKTYTAFSTTLTAGSTINSIVTSMNSAFATNNAAFTASKTVDGKLKITADGYGEDIWFQVFTDNEGADHIWNVTDGLRNTVDDGNAGVDVVGFINNHVADGIGNILTSLSGFNENGLQISTTSNQTGYFGTITVTSGVADRLPSILDSYVNSDSGILKTKETSMQSSIDDITDRISIMEKRIEVKEERLRAEFTRLELIMAKFESVSQFVTNTLASLPTVEAR